MSKLLIVDDSAELLEVMKYILERNGYTVKTLIRADDIDREISEFQPDLLIPDIFSW
jgi:DNA-binding response OmpR family regulator